MEREITPYMRTRDSALRKNSPLYGPERFTYLPESNSYLCPAGEQLNYGGHNARNRTHVYIGTRKRCGACPQKAQCTTAPIKYLAIHMHESARQRARDLVNTTGLRRTHREKKESGSVVCGTQESDRTSSPAPTENKVRSGAVLPGGSGAKYQTAGAVPQSSTETERGYDLAFILV